MRSLDWCKYMYMYMYNVRTTSTDLYGLSFTQRVLEQVAACKEKKFANNQAISSSVLSAY